MEKPKSFVLGRWQRISMFKPRGFGDAKSVSETVKKFPEIGSVTTYRPARQMVSERVKERVTAKI